MSRGGLSAVRDALMIANLVKIIDNGKFILLYDMFKFGLNAQSTE